MKFARRAEWKNVILITILLTGVFHVAPPFASAGSVTWQPVRTVPTVDLGRYVGAWYEIARYPNFFQKGCRDSTAHYTLRPDGEISILNRCLKGDAGEASEAKGRAWVAAPPDTARLKVMFFWPFRGDYWIIELGDNYEYAVVGTPDREYLWILSRTPTLSDTTYADILQKLAQQGFDPAKLLKTNRKAI